METHPSSAWINSGKSNLTSPSDLASELLNLVPDSTLFYILLLQNEVLIPFKSLGLGILHHVATRKKNMPKF